ncbi:MAG: HPP family protein [Burkholderiaceae bacterium]
MALAIIGALGMAVGMPWLFPSLGPTIAIQTTTPDAPAAQPWNVVVGHLLGLASGFAAVHVSGAVNMPSVAAAHALSLPRMLAAVFAVLLSMLLQASFKASHPPAEATTLLIALGALEANGRNALIIALGVALVTLIGQSAKPLFKP